MLRIIATKSWFVGNHAQPRSNPQRLNPITDTQLVVDVAEVKIHRSFRDGQFLGRLPTAIALGN